MSDAAGGRILLVDGAGPERAALTEVFSQQGCTVTAPRTAQEALDLVEREAFDVVLLDVDMPDLNGLEVLRRIRQWNSEDELPVIMMTAGAGGEVIAEALREGANDYITKPVDCAVAQLRVSTQVARRRAEEQVRQVNTALNRANDDLELRIVERTAELLRSNEQLRVAMAEAQAANKAKDDFLVTVSHELRTPLNGLIAMGQLLSLSPLDEAQRRMADIINSSAVQLNGVVADLLDALDLRSGQVRLSIQPVSLAQLLREAAAAAATKAAARGLTFRLDLSPDTEIEAAVDAARLRQVLDKLVDNAVKFTERGEIVLSAAIDLDALREAPDRLRVTICDTGMGFDQATSARLFRAFEQADGSMSRRFGGLGMGLAISQALVDLMGGKISADGRVGEGACFTIELPLRAAAVHPA